MTLIFNFYMVFVFFDGECIYLTSVNCLICLSFYRDCDARQFQVSNPQIPKSRWCFSVFCVCIQQCLSSLVLETI
uniref:Putative secreted protein n=1 Tax=Ixodes ricinus TaxID=34613 RepID=A0A6B0TTA5_IXORI